MIQLQSKLNIVDNSGALKARVIKTKKKFARLGEKVVVSIQKNIPYSKIRKGDIAKAILIRSKCRESLISHSQIWKSNDLILINIPKKGSDFHPVGSRIKGPISTKLKRLKGMQKIISISKRTL